MSSPFAREGRIRGRGHLRVVPGNGSGPTADPVTDPAGEPVAPGVPPGPPPEELDQPGDPESVARALCLRKLTARPCTRHELADLLAKRGIPKAAAEAVLDRFAEVGLIDDAGLAASYAVARHEEQGMARAAIATRLRRRGVQADAVRAAVEQIDPASEEIAARELVLKRLPGMARLDDATKARRLVGQLARKGYPAGLRYRVVREVVAEVELPTE